MYSLEPPRRGGSNEYPQSMFWAEIWKKIEFFLSENFQFFGGKIFSIFEQACFRNGTWETQNEAAPGLQNLCLSTHVLYKLAFTVETGWETPKMTLHQNI